MAVMKYTRQPRIGFPTLTGPTLFPIFDDVENRMNRYFDQFFNTPFTNVPETINWMPATDIFETPTELVLTAELPGMDEKDIEISIEDGILLFRGEKVEEKKEGKDDEKKMFLFERSYGAFQRSFTLPKNIDEKLVTAEFSKGVLKIHMPKSEDVKPKGHKVEIKKI